MAQATSKYASKQAVPVFRLKDTNSNSHYSFDELKGSKGTLLLFISNDCPFVQHALPEILMIANDYRVHGIGVIAISSNDSVVNPENSAANMTEFAFRNKIDFPYLFDESQYVAKFFDVKCTPDFYLFNAQDELFYHGQLDDSRPGNGIPSSGNDLRAAIDAIIYNRTIATPQKPSFGCTIKWKN